MTSLDWEKDPLNPKVYHAYSESSGLIMGTAYMDGIKNHHAIKYFQAESIQLGVFKSRASAMRAVEKAVRK